MGHTIHYHLKFELYQTPNPLSRAPNPKSVPGARSGNHRGGGGNVSDLEKAIWRPTVDSTIFDNLPSHTPRSKANTTTQSFPASQSRPVSLDVDGTHSAESPGYRAGIGPHTAVHDWRFGRINIESIDLGSLLLSFSRALRQQRTTMDGKEKMEVSSEGPGTKGKEEGAAVLGPSLGGAGLSTKARYTPLDTKNTEAGWGIVHLYKESVEPSAIKATPVGPAEGGSSAAGGRAAPAVDDEEATVLCIPSVPGYVSPLDFLDWVGDKWRGDVTHYRMVMTSTMYRYMVLMKFQDHRRAAQWQKEFDGKAFPGLRSDICHVTFIKSITFETPEQAEEKGPWGLSSQPPAVDVGQDVRKPLKPFPPPTPNLTELPTCSVCLERMDDTTGLVTIPCQHIFHCACLQTWNGSGCPVCRATTPATHMMDAILDPNDPTARPFGQDISNICYMCDWNDDLWICLICGNVGCGRYKNGHAKEHWKNTAHSFSLEVKTQYVWDYSSDKWVHRLLRNKEDKVVELPTNPPSHPASQQPEGEQPGGSSQQGEGDYVPRAKLDKLSVEYAAIFSKQLDTQRKYFEDLVNKARDRASKAIKAAELASIQAEQARQELSELKEEHRAFKEGTNSTIPSLEKNLDRERKKAEKSTDLCRKLTKSLQEEKEMGQGLMKRIEHLEEQLRNSMPVREHMEKVVREIETHNQGLVEELNDLRMFISSQEKFAEMVKKGEVEEGDLEGGSVSVGKGKGKGKGQAKK